MALPNPIPDNPMRWEGWRDYHSEDFYARLCLSYESNPSPEQIEENCRQLLVWWQKKLPLKNQPSNPLPQMLRAGMDEAPAYLAEARTKLLDPEGRAEFDHRLHSQIVLEALGEFKKLLVFALGDNRLREEDENRLYERGRGLGLSRDEMKAAVEEELSRVGAGRVAATTFVAAPTPGSAAGGGGAGRPRIRLRNFAACSGCRNWPSMAKRDDRRPTGCALQHGRGLGLTGGQAEDFIDEYLDEASGLPPAPSAPAAARPPSRRQSARSPRPSWWRRNLRSGPAPLVTKELVQSSPLVRAGERLKYPNFITPSGIEMLLIPSGVFAMGSAAKDAALHEQPIAQVSLSCFYLGRFPVTNAQYEIRSDSRFQARCLGRRQPPGGLCE